MSFINIIFTVFNFGNNNILFQNYVENTKKVLAIGDAARPISS